VPAQPVDHRFRVVEDGSRNEGLVHSIQSGTYAYQRGSIRGHRRRRRAEARDERIEILSFLEEHADQAFTQTEIAEATGVKRGSVGPTLVRLRENGRVEHRGTYWRISDHVRSVDAATNHTADTAASYEDAPLAYDEWQEHAVDPRENRD